MYNEDGSLRPQRAISAALHKAGLGAKNDRVREQLRAAGGVRPQPSATDQQIRAHLYNYDGTRRTRAEVASALHAAGLGASDARLGTHLQAAGATRHLPGATDEQIRAHLHNDDGSLRPQKDVVSALHAIGLGAGELRVTAQLRAVGATRYMPGATDEQIRTHLYRDNGSLRTKPEVADALHDAGLGVSDGRLGTLLRAAHAQQ